MKTSNQLMMISERLSRAIIPDGVQPRHPTHLHGRGKKDAHEPPETPRRKPAMRPVTLPPPPKRVAAPKGPSPRARDIENFEKFEAEERCTQTLKDLEMSSDGDEKDDCSCIGRNSVSPSEDP